MSPKALNTGFFKPACYIYEVRTIFLCTFASNIGMQKSVPIFYYRNLFH